MQKISLILLVTIVAATILGANSTSAQQLVRVGYSGTGVAKNLHKTIERVGLWKKRGLDVRLIYFTSGATMAQAMVGGDLEIADSDVPAMLNAISAGALDAKLISVYVNRFPFAFVVRNEIKSAEDLKGKRLAISRFGSSLRHDKNVAASFQIRPGQRRAHHPSHRYVAAPRDGGRPTRWHAPRNL